MSFTSELLGGYFLFQRLFLLLNFVTSHHGCVHLLALPSFHVSLTVLRLPSRAFLLVWLLRIIHFLTCLRIPFFCFGRVLGRSLFKKLTSNWLSIRMVHLEEPYTLQIVYPWVGFRSIFWKCLLLAIQHITLTSVFLELLAILKTICVFSIGPSLMITEVSYK